MQLLLLLPHVGEFCGKFLINLLQLVNVQNTTDTSQCNAVHQHSCLPESAASSSHAWPAACIPPVHLGAVPWQRFPRQLQPSAPHSRALLEPCVTRISPYTATVSQLVDWCLTALSAQTGYIVPQEYEIHHVGPGDKTSKQLNNETIQRTKKIINTLWPWLYGADSVATISLSSQSLGKY